MFVIFLACSLYTQVCGQEVIQISEEPVNTLQQCMLNAQPQLARWSMYHPNKRINKWSCTNDKSRTERSI
jgi:hypothetical protein